jgi:hypothetical protein
MSLSESIIKSKALQLHKTMYNTMDCPFSASKGWIYRFKKRNRVRLFNIFGEAGQVDEEYISKELPNIQGITRQ